MRTGRLYPRDQRLDTSARKAEQLRIKKVLRPWRVDYDLTYDNGSIQWTGYYRTYLTARIAAFLNVAIKSWGGDAYLYRAEQKGLF